MSGAARRLPVLEDVSLLQHVSDRPRNRSECRDGERPCPWVSCRYHLAVDITHSGRLRELVDMEAVTAATPTCAIDVADEGESTLERIGGMLDMSRERVRQIEAEAMARATEDSSLGAHASERSGAPRSRVTGPRNGVCRKCSKPFTHHGERGPVPPWCQKCIPNRRRLMNAARSRRRRQLKRRKARAVH